MPALINQPTFCCHDGFLVATRFTHSWEGRSMRVARIETEILTPLHDGTINDVQTLQKGTLRASREFTFVSYFGLYSSDIFPRWRNIHLQCVRLNNSISWIPGCKVSSSSICIISRGTVDMSRSPIVNLIHSERCAIDIHWIFFRGGTCLSGPKPEAGSPSVSLRA